MTTDGRRPGATRERALALAVPALGLAFAVLLLATSGHLVGPSGWYARILAVVFGAIALVGLVAELTRSRRVAPQADTDEELPAVSDDENTRDGQPRGGLTRVGILVASVVAMILLAEPLGFWLSMIIPVATALIVLGVRTWWKVLLAVTLTVAGGYIVFTLLLQVRVPEGILGLF